MTYTNSKEGNRIKEKMVDTVPIPLKFEVSTDPLMTYLRISLFFSARTTRTDKVERSRIQAIFRTFINGEAQPSGRKPQQYNGYAVDPPRPVEPLTFSSEIQGLTMQRLQENMKSLVPVRWNAEERTAIVRVVSWGATSCQLIDRPPGNPSSIEKDASALFKKVLKESCGRDRRFLVIVRDWQLCYQQSQSARVNPGAGPCDILALD
jgi:hypothetical protein